jgi:alpha-glucuronidase
MSYNQCWLNYHKLKNYKDADILRKLYIIKANNNPTGVIVENAVKELSTALRGMLDINLEYNIEQNDVDIASLTNSIILTDSSHEVGKEQLVAEKLGEEGYLIHQSDTNIYIIGNTENGILYGCFELIRRIAMGDELRGMRLLEKPKNRFRMLNHWDNLDGSIERGYSGESFFFEREEILIDERTIDYARMVASIGINAVVINNVNVRGKAASGLITDRYLGRLREMVAIFSGFGIKLYLSVNFAAPLEIGGIGSADPCDEGVADWWRTCVDNIYRQIPDFGGFLIKADSEGRPGPFTYGRTHADGANVLARALKPYNGILIWRCFVYNCQQDWRDHKTDRARASYDNFMSLDGQFEENVILQIKNGPMDFQVREPVSPLFGGLKKTNQMLEVQIAQEYTGQQKHVCYLVPMWKEVLSFNTHAEETGATVADIVAGRTYHQTNCGIAAVANTGNDYNWTGHDLAAANLYGLGRLCWNTELTSEQIMREWILLTFSQNEKVMTVLSEILLNSWSTYEKYTSPLGIGWMVNPNNHYGPNVDGYEYDKWGTYHRADRNGVGVDRTMNGTGYATQYNEPNVSMYENLQTCPEELLLFFHHVSYDYVLRSGKTLIQHIYDTHFEGVNEVENMIKGLKTLQELLPQDVYLRMSERFELQLESAVEWRDRINTYFYRKSGVDDCKHRKIYC